MSATRRQLLLDLLAMGPWEVEALRRELQVAGSLLEDDLRHLDKSLRAAGRRLVVEGASCPACGFSFAARQGERYRRPSRCPRCKNERLSEPRLSIAARG